MLSKIFMFIFALFLFVTGELFIYFGEKEFKALGGTICALGGILLVAAFEWKV